MNRRDLIKLGLYGGTAGMLHLTRSKSGAFVWALDEVSAKAKKKPKLGTPFANSLPLPPVKQPVNPSTLPGAPIFNDGIPTTYYEVNQVPGKASILQGAQTVIWGYDGIYMGPTFQAAIGERVVVRHHNNLGVTAIVHHHGAHTPGVSDGSALLTQQIQPGTFRDYVYPNDDDVSATHWYHDHDLDFTGHNVFMGLEGAFLLHDKTELSFNLPGNPNDPPPPGELPFDLPLIIQDRAFDPNNQLAYNPFGHDGFLGDHFLVNGAIQPFVRVANRKYRFRLLNGSNARFYTLTLSNGMPFHVIGSDGGLFAKAVEASSILIGPAERYEVIIDFSSLKPGPTTQVFLVNCEAQTKGTGPDGVVSHCAANPTVGFDGVGSLLCFDVLFSVPDPSIFTPGQTLRNDLPTFDANAAVATRTWEFQRSNGAWQINGQFYDPNRIDAFCKTNTIEIWTLKNGGGGWYHPVHIHRNQFRILSRNGGPPGPLEQNLKDVFVLEGGDTVSVITAWTGPNVVGDYVMHCHNVEHEDMRMMIRFNVS